jgi:ribosomal protein S12 methylthiotransferase
VSRTIHFVSLGCPKNTVDTERMVALARRQGLSPIDDPTQSDVIVVNSCGFIDAAKQESIDTVLQMAEHKHDGRCRSLVMAGCLSQRYPDELSREIPEVDHFLGTADLGRLEQILAREDDTRARIAVGRPEGLEEATYERELVGPAHTAYLKISEGCNRPCAFCAIPLMRGRQRSRTIDSLVAEARALAAQGVRELILVAQDSTAYGRDLPRGSADLVQLLEALEAVEELCWVRIHYAYPSMVDARLAQAMRDLLRVVPYIDMPIQHVDDEVLRRMRRGYTGDRVQRAVEQLREQVPQLRIRTTMLVGHPGETNAAHQALLTFVRELEIDHLGAFVFSPEQGTPAAEQPDQVPRELGEQRRDELMALQRDISRQRLQGLRGTEVDVLVDGPSDESEFLREGRYFGQSPGIDGVVILADSDASAGALVRARVSDTADYDLVAHQLPS